MSSGSVKGHFTDFKHGETSQGSSPCEKVETLLSFWGHFLKSKKITGDVFTAFGAFSRKSALQTRT